MGAHTFAGLYLAAVGVWLGLTVAILLRRLLPARREEEPLLGLHVYELARLSGGWPRVGDVLLVKLLETVSSRARSRGKASATRVAASGSSS